MEEVRKALDGAEENTLIVSREVRSFREKQVVEDRKRREEEEEADKYENLGLGLGLGVG